MFEGFGWPSLESLPTVLAIAGAAAGPLVKLEVSGLAAPVAPLFHTAIWHPGQGDCTAIQALIQWLQRASQPAARVLNRKEMDRRILAIKAERDDFFALEAVPDPLVEAEFEAQIRDLEVEPQTLLVLDSPKGSQVEAFMTKAPSSALVFYSAMGFERLMGKGTSRWLRDCERLVDSGLCSISVCGTESLGRLLSVENPWAEQIILTRLPGQAKAAWIDGEAMSSLLMGLIEEGRTESPRVIELPGEARQILEEAEGKEPDPSVARRLTVTACQVALVLYRCALAREPELDKQLIQAALPAAREVLSRSAEVKRIVKQRRDEALLRRKMARMLRRIKKCGTIKQRDLFRDLRGYGPGQGQEAVAAFLRSGRVRQRREKRSIVLSYHEK